MRPNKMVLNDKLEDISIEKMYSFPFEVSFSEIRNFSKGYVKLHWHDEIQISIVTRVYRVYSWGKVIYFKEWSGNFYKYTKNTHG